MGPTALPTQTGAALTPWNARYEPSQLPAPPVQQVTPDVAAPKTASPAVGAAPAKTMSPPPALGGDAKASTDSAPQDCSPHSATELADLQVVARGADVVAAVGSAPGRVAATAVATALIAICMGASARAASSMGLTGPARPPRASARHPRAPARSSARPPRPHPVGCFKMNGCHWIEPSR